MSNYQTNLSEIAAKSLGDSTSYAVYTDQIDPTLLNPLPRTAGLMEMGIPDVIHVGGDVWHGHEMTFLIDSGAPVAGTLKVMYQASTPNMIESKSFKIYLNTFDMCKMGPTVEEATNNMVNRVAADLSEVAGGKVEVRFFPDNAQTHYFDDVKYTPIEQLIDINSVHISDYKGNETHLVTKQATAGIHTIAVSTNALRSRCRVTKQRDIGSAFIKIETSDCVVDVESLFKQIVSLREQDEFHEFCSSKLYSEIMKAPGVVACCVTLLYSRRGSLDICPTRATREDMLPKVLLDVNQLTQKTQGQ